MRSKATTTNRKSGVRRQRDPLPWKYCLLTLVCGLILAAGFFGAARSHFSSMDFGMKNAKLRKQIEELKSENRRLQLTREMALSPAQIKKAAKKLGLTTLSAKNIEIVGANKPAEQPEPAAGTPAADPEIRTFRTDDKKEKTEDRTPPSEKDPRKTKTGAETVKIRAQIAKK